MPYFKDSQNNVYWLDSGDDPLVWLPNCEAITDLEADNLRSNKKEAAFNSLSYAEKRRSEYPSIGDQLDALWKGGDAASDMFDRIKSIKEKYQKNT
jgi:hypothetical protein